MRAPRPRAGLDGLHENRHRYRLIKQIYRIGALAAAAAFAVPLAFAGDPPAGDFAYPDYASQPQATVAVYRAMSAAQSSNYDRAQDISPRQMVILLEVAERTGTNLGQALATGEHESAHTWNDHIRPTLKSGGLGSATGVWQFQPATFHAIIRRYGAKLLAASEADSATEREHLDLGAPPFADAKVRSLIQQAVDGERRPEDEELQLLRQNFAVLAFAKHFLSVDSGAQTPEEDYLFHFLGSGQGREVLALARGEARDTLAVKPVAQPETIAGSTADYAFESERALAAAPAGYPTRDLERQRIRLILSAGAGLNLEPGIASESAVYSPPVPPEPPPVSSQWGLPADSPTVTGNLGMFYRDGKGQSDPYTWGEFMDNLARRVRVKEQPTLVRAKYGVGFEALTGGDVPERAVNPEKVSDAAEFRDEHGEPVLVPDAFVSGPLDRDETALYKQRLAALVNQGDDEPLETLPPESLAALRHLGILDSDVQATDTSDPRVRKAVHAFRDRFGKEEPTDPANADRLMPAERIALEVYDRRIAHYAALQQCQRASLADAPDLNRIRKLPSGLQQPTTPHIGALQRALVAQGLLKNPVKKTVWRDKKRKKRVSYKTVPFAGIADKATVAALQTYQLRNGLRQTDGVVDAVTLELLGLPPMGPEIFLPLSGPQCAIDAAPETVSWCEVQSDPDASEHGIFTVLAPRALLPERRQDFWIEATNSDPDLTGSESDPPTVVDAGVAGEVAR